MCNTIFTHSPLSHIIIHVRGLKYVPKDTRLTNRLFRLSPRFTSPLIVTSPTIPNNVNTPWLQFSYVILDWNGFGMSWSTITPLSMQDDGEITRMDENHQHATDSSLTSLGRIRNWNNICLHWDSDQVRWDLRSLKTRHATPYPLDHIDLFCIFIFHDAPVLWVIMANSMFTSTVRYNLYHMIRWVKLKDTRTFSVNHQPMIDGRATIS